MSTTPTRNAMAELRPSLVAVRCAEAGSGGSSAAPVPAEAPGAEVAAESVLPALTGCGFLAAAVAAVGIGGSRPARIFSWTSGSSARSLPRRLETRAVTTMPTMHEGTVTARIWVSPKLYSSVSVRVSIAAIAAETGDAASATPDCTTLTVMGRDGRIPLRYDTS